jgi:hypothetical protein
MIDQGSGAGGPGSSPARVFRVLHAAIFLGLVIVGVVFGAVARLRQGSELVPVKNLAPILATVGAVLLVLALAVLRPRIPARPAEQSPDEYWKHADTRGLTVLLWVALESSGMVSAVGYLLTGTAIAAAMAGAAILALFAVRPSRLESL